MGIILAKPYARFSSEIKLEPHLPPFILISFLILRIYANFFGIGKSSPIRAAFLWFYFLLKNIFDVVRDPLINEFLPICHFSPFPPFPPFGQLCHQPNKHRRSMSIDFFSPQVPTLSSVAVIERLFENFDPNKQKRCRRIKPINMITSKISTQIELQLTYDIF